MLVTMATQPLVSPGDQQLFVWTANTQALHLFWKDACGFIWCSSAASLGAARRGSLRTTPWFTLKKKKKKGTDHGTSGFTCIIRADVQRDLDLRV